MKVIDLLNKIANGEEVPKKVKAGYYYYELEEKGEYINIDDTEDLLFDFDSYFPLEQSLNQEIEIIEEDKKIENLDIYNCFEVMGNSVMTQKRLDENFTDISNKINEIIDKLNKGDETVSTL